MLENVEYIIFDLNGTLVSGRYPSYIDTLEALGYANDQAIKKHFTKKQRRAIARGHPPIMHVIQQLCEDDDPERAKRKIFDRKISQVRLAEGAIHILEQLKPCFTLILASDTTGIGKHVVEHFQLGDYFQERFFSCDVGFLKHERGFWTSLLDHLPHAAPSECVVVGDNPATDIRIPNQMGMHTILVPSSVQATSDYTADPKGTHHETPDHTLERLEGLMSLFDRLE